MSDQQTATEDSPNKPPIREDLVLKATKFLENPKVIKTSLVDQQRFLRRKGLTDEEIRTACERSGAYTFHEQRNKSQIQLPSDPLISFSNTEATQLSLFYRIKEIVHNMGIISFVTYVIYKFYKNFIAPFLFGKKKKSLEDTICDLNRDMKESINDLQNSICTVKVEVDKISQEAETSTQRQLLDLKSEIATVKGLLLSRNQFPPVSKTPLVRPSIPAWQKTSISHDSDSDPERKAEDLLEVGSGSGSSEPEHNAKNSDSSLDIISFSSKDSDFRRHKKTIDDDDDDDKD